MVEVHIHVPVRNNSGRKFAPSVHSDFEAELDSLFGGHSLQPGLFKGAWQHGGKTYRDQTRAYSVSIEGLLASAAGLIAVVEYAKANYDQLAIYVRYLGVSEVL